MPSAGELGGGLPGAAGGLAGLGTQLADAIGGLVNRPDGALPDPPQLEDEAIDDGPPRKAQTWAGTDRQCRGRLLAVLRDAEGAVPQRAMDQAWDDKTQRDRCLASLLTDGLLVRVPEGYALPG